MRTTNINTTLDNLNALVHASRSLRSWHERLCGDSYGVIFYDDGQAYYQSYAGGARRRVRDTGAACKRVIAALCSHLGLHYYIQDDPRGPALYVAKVPLSASNYLADGEPIG